MSVLQALSHTLCVSSGTGTEGGFEDSIDTPAKQQDLGPDQSLHRGIETDFGCVDWYLYPQEIEEGASLP